MQDDLGVIVSFGVRESGSAEETDTAQFLRGSLEELGLEVDQRDVPLPTGSASTNLIVTFGSGTPHVLLGAHYDSKPPSPGADDNGSGTVVLLELARRLAEASPQDLRVTVVFLGAEEILIGYDRSFHHFGSRLLAQQMADDGDLPDFMISADMIGVGDRILGATYRDLDASAAQLLAEAALALGIDVSIESRGDISDHEAFAQLGVPSVMFWRPDNPNYHLVADDHARTEALLDDLAILEGFLDLVGP